MTDQSSQWRRKETLLSKAKQLGPNYDYVLFVRRRGPRARTEICMSSSAYTCGLIADVRKRLFDAELPEAPKKRVSSVQSYDDPTDATEVDDATEETDDVAV